ncbi:unnamed protein product [Spirodela intermedia]|uniref:SFR19-like C-terminal domain-containing protein n=1 Tax=Spirodela intermedia TaxID=51605 RepID=A0A7I8JFK2_SPIIN|nr:unnamed protein product [Spirodela intermedia]CAA6668711.1 unnamed protein product [Spirodela intermedia]
MLESTARQRSPACHPGSHRTLQSSSRLPHRPWEKKPRRPRNPPKMAAEKEKDGEGKKAKEGKGVRVFKCTLVEFVKEVLRPTWKEGQMSKEAHKTIVKKAVDKVVSTLDGNIPHTKERIDLYMSYSKEKLTKLVQAYVEKYMKT